MQPFDDDPEFLYDDDPDEPIDRRLSLTAVLVLIVLILAMLSSLMWPIMYRYTNPSYYEPTPTPPYLREI